jgi:NAD dependent epimerase/dehydratase family enzyme
MPWIHVDDVAEVFSYAVENEISGAWNATSPNPVRNSEFTKDLARTLGRPALFPVPALALKLAFGEFAQHMVDSARVIPENLVKAGFQFRHPELGEALRDLLAA